MTASFIQFIDYYALSVFNRILSVLDICFVWTSFKQYCFLKDNWFKSIKGHMRCFNPLFIIKVAINLNEAYFMTIETIFRINHCITVIHTYATSIFSKQYKGEH